TILERFNATDPPQAQSAGMPSRTTNPLAVRTANTAEYLAHARPPGDTLITVSAGGQPRAKAGVRRGNVATIGWSLRAPLTPFLRFSTCRTVPAGRFATRFRSRSVRRGAPTHRETRIRSFRFREV